MPRCLPVRAGSPTRTGSPSRRLGPLTVTIPLETGRNPLCPDPTHPTAAARSRSVFAPGSGRGSATHPTIPHTSWFLSHLAPPAQARICVGREKSFACVTVVVTLSKQRRKRIGRIPPSGSGIDTIRPVASHPVPHSTCARLRRTSGMDRRWRPHAHRAHSRMPTGRTRACPPRALAHAHRAHPARRR